jgi:hypothetical protein
VQELDLPGPAPDALPEPEPDLSPTPPPGSQVFTKETPTPPWATVPKAEFWLDHQDIDIGVVKPLLPGKTSTGVVMVEDGKVWVYGPKNHFGGYELAFPKGKLELQLTPQQNASASVRRPKRQRNRTPRHRTCPAQGSDAFLEGRRLAASGQCRDTIPYFNQALQANPRYAKAYSDRGR